MAAFDGEGQFEGVVIVLMGILMCHMELKEFENTDKYIKSIESIGERIFRTNSEFSTEIFASAFMFPSLFYSSFNLQDKAIEYANRGLEILEKSGKMFHPLAFDLMLYMSTILPSDESLEVLRDLESLIDEYKYILGPNEQYILHVVFN